MFLIIASDSFIFILSKTSEFICNLILVARINPIQLSEQRGKNQIRA